MRGILQPSAETTDLTRKGNSNVLAPVSIISVFTVCYFCWQPYPSLPKPVAIVTGGLGESFIYRNNDNKNNISTLKKGISWLTCPDTVFTHLSRQKTSKMGGPVTKPRSSLNRGHRGSNALGLCPCIARIVVRPAGVYNHKSICTPLCYVMKTYE